MHVVFSLSCRSSFPSSCSPFSSLLPSKIDSRSYALNDAISLGDPMCIGSNVISLAHCVAHVVTLLKAREYFSAFCIEPLVSNKVRRLRKTADFFPSSLFSSFVFDDGDVAADESMHRTKWLKSNYRMNREENIKYRRNGNGSTCATLVICLSMLHNDCKSIFFFALLFLRSSTFSFPSACARSRKMHTALARTLTTLFGSKRRHQRAEERKKPEENPRKIDGTKTIHRMKSNRRQFLHACAVVFLPHCRNFDGFAETIPNAKLLGSEIPWRCRFPLMQGTRGQCANGRDLFDIYRR